MNNYNRNVLITSHYLKDFTGSEIAAYDVAREFINFGFKVTVGSFEFTFPLKTLFDKLNCDFIDLNEVDDKCDDKFDIIWAQHFTTIDKILLETKISSDFIIYSSLSPYEALESPPLSSEKINLFLANSLETKDKLLYMGLSNKSIYLLPNPVSDKFFEKGIISLDKVKRIAIVSNHIPDEIRKTIVCLKNDNFDVVLYGMEGVFELITPDILKQYDAVITIGRTVQYCLAMRIPVYCYDRFGGCGWITSYNIENASKFNFSGRCTNRKLTVNEIVKEIKENYDIAKSNINSNLEFAEKNYKLSYHLSYILNSFKNNYIEFNINFFKKVALRQREYLNSSSSPTYFIQLFIDDGNTYSEENSLKHKVIQNNEIQKFEFDLKDKHRIKFLRLDPFNDSCVIEIEELNIILNDGSHIDLIPHISANVCFHHGKSYFFEFFDPQIYFENIDFEKLDSIEKLCVEVKYSHIAKDAVHVCANQIATDKNYQISIIEKEKMELQEILSSMENKASNLEKEKMELQESLNSMENKASNFEKEKMELQENINSLENRAVNLENELLGVYTSKSWKLTRRLRNLAKGKL